MSFLFFILSVRLAAEVEPANHPPQADEIARLVERIGSPDTEADAEARGRLRAVLGSLATEASAGGPAGTRALAAILDLCASPKRTAAMEGVLAVLSVRGSEGVRALLAAHPRIDPAVRRHGLDFLYFQGTDISGLAEEVIAALGAEGRPDVKERLARLAGRLGTPEAARAVLLAALPPGAAPDLEEACFEALGELARSQAAREWLEREGPRTAAASPGGVAVLARTAAAVPFPGVVPGLLGLLDGGEEATLLAVLDAVDRLASSEDSADPAREALLRFLREPASRPSGALTRRAASILARLDPEGAIRTLGERAGAPSWEARRAALEGLAELSGRDEAFVLVSSLLDDPNREVRAAAFAALGRFRRKEAVDRAVGIANSVRGPRRDQAVAFLEEATGRKGDDARGWAHWWAAERETFRFPPEKPAPIAWKPGETWDWKLTPLLVGLCSLGEDHVLGGGRTADRRIPFAIYAFLAEGPHGEVVLIDLGPKTLAYTNDMFRRYGFFRESDGARSRPDDIVQPDGNVLDQLARRGIAPERVGQIIYSHLHADHHGMDDAKGPGAAADFPAAVLHVSKKGWLENLKRRKPGGGWGSYVDYAFSDFLLAMGEKGRCVFEDDALVLPGLRTRYLGGHAECSQAVIVDVPGGQAILSSDEVYRYDLLEQGLLARLFTTRERLLEATDLLTSLAMDREDVLVPSHDPAVAEAFRKAGGKWLEELGPRSYRAARAYKELRMKGGIRAAGGGEKR
jgi:glyoxylase-like metal-dependent hydrolase (beta-lactamase superfamily II)